MRRKRQMVSTRMRLVLPEVPLTVPPVRTCKIQGVLDETATANKASMAVLYTTKMENPASGMVRRR